VASDDDVFGYFMQRFLILAVGAGRSMKNLLHPLANYGLFAPLPFRPLDDSPPGSFTPWLIRPLACLSPGWFAHAPWTIRPWVYCDAMSAVHTRARGANKRGGRIVQGAWANQPGGEQARRRTSQGAKQQRGKKARYPLATGL